MPNRRYTPKQKAEAVGIATMMGVTEAGRETGIPKQTIDYWRSDPRFGHLRTRAREEVVADLWIGVQIGAEALIRGMESDAPLRDKAQAWAALTDRYALLAGEATTRSEHRDIADEPDRNPALDAAETAYLRVLASPAAVGGSNGARAASNGHSTIPPVRLPGSIADGYVEAPVDPEGSTNGHQSNGRDRGEVAS